MQRIYYAGEHFLTGTEIANALVSYAEALAQNGKAGSIEIPVRHEDDGRVGVVNFLVEEVDSLGSEEVMDDEVVARLRTLTADLEPMHPVINVIPVERDDSVGYDWTDEV
jgi:hypothetical protein